MHTEGPTKSFAVLTTDNYKALADILLNDNFDTENIDALVKLKTLFDSCNDTEDIERRGVQPLLDLLNKTGMFM